MRLVPKLLFYRIVYGRWLDILVTHAPPFGIHDRKDRCHTGFKTFLSFMRWFKPRYLVHGHVHLYDLNETRTTRYRQTEVVNAYEHTVIEIEVPSNGSK
jgi:Icc-related predicted phosphoesterase